MSARSFRRQRAREIRRERQRVERRARRAIATGALIGAAALAGPAAAGAETTFTVDNTADTTTAGACDPGIADDCSLRQAVEDANSNPGADVISFAGLSGNLITLTQGQVNVTDDLSIQGPGASALTISGDANRDGVHDLAYYGTVARSGDSRVFQFGPGATSGTGVTASVSDLTISGGTSGVSSKYTTFPSPHTKYEGNSGGGILAFNSDLTVDRVTMTDNQASAGGGAIGTTTSGATPTVNSLTVIDSDLRGNTAYSGGGAVNTSGAVGSLTVTDSDVTGNRTEGKDFKYDGATGTGGGILGANLTDAAITGSTLSDNDATDAPPTAGAPTGKSARGGGVYLSGNPSSVDLDIADTTISGNTAVKSGGGAYLVGHDVTVRHSSVDGNSVRNDEAAGAATGGGVFARANLMLGSSTISGNSARNTTTADQARGGGLYWKLATNSQGVTVGSSTISGNQSTGDGGGALISTDAFYSPGPPPTTAGSGPVRFFNSTVAGNSGSAGGGIFEQASGSTGHLPPAETLSSTIVGANTPDDLAASTYSAGFEAGNSLIQSDVSGIPFTQNPAGSNVLGVDPQLGPLKDNAGPTDTMMPATGSPAIDAGVANGRQADQRGFGFARTADDPNVADRPGSDGTDIGSVERQVEASGSGPATPTTPRRKRCKGKKKHRHKKASAAKKKCKKKGKK